MVTTIVIAVACFAVGAGLSYLLFKHGLKTRYDNIIKEAHTEAEVIKKNKLLEVKEKFLNKKADLEKEVSIRNQKIQQAENKLKQREMVLNQKQDEVQRKRNEAEAIKENLEAQIAIVDQKKVELDKKKEELEKIHVLELEKLEALSGLSAERTIASGVSSTTISTPVAASKARMFRPSRPMMRPLISSESMWKTVTEFSMAVSVATRWMDWITMRFASLFAVILASSMMSLMYEAASVLASSFKDSIKLFQAFLQKKPRSA